MPALEWIDTAVNLLDRRFEPDRQAVFARARAAGVSAMLLLGTDAQSSAAAAALRPEGPVTLYSTAGVHPHYANTWDAACRAQIAELAAHPGVVAVGECGLDFFRDLSPRRQQRDAFAGQLELAVTLGRPLVIHEREAHDALTEIVAAVASKLAGAVLHCFTGSALALDRYLDLGLYIGITGWACDERRGQALLQLLPRIPAERLLLETDAPYLLPRSLRPRPKSRRNEPAFLPHIAETVARVRGETMAQLSANSCANARRLFRLPQPSAGRDGDVPPNSTPTGLDVTGQTGP